MKHYQFSILLLISILFGSCFSTKKLADVQADGSSFKQAISVNSIAEEYAYVREVCPDCVIIAQSLQFHKKKAYDVLEFEQADGTTIYYYFDISSFFGKGF